MSLQMPRPRGFPPSDRAAVGSEVGAGEAQWGGVGEWVGGWVILALACVERVARMGWGWAAGDGLPGMGCRGWAAGTGAGKSSVPHSARG